jgi:Zn-dependent alcohol dehydrogenase
VVDTTANPDVVRSAIDALAIRGTCAVVGVPPAGTEASIDVTGQLVGKRFIGATEVTSNRTFSSRSSSSFTAAADCRSNA